MKLNVGKVSLVQFSIILVPFFVALDSDGAEYFGFNSIQLFLTFAILAYAFFEEVIFRCFIPSIFGCGIVVVFLSSIGFSLLHITNVGFGIIPFINTFLMSIVLYQIRFSLGFGYAVMFHFLWNSVLVVVLGTPVSGYDVQKFLTDDLGWHTSSSILSIESNYKAGYGVEESVELLFSLVFIIFITIAFDKLFHMARSRNAG